MLQRFLGIHPDEKRSMLIFSLLAFCWSIASSSGIALSDALFLKHVGSEALSYTFALTALGMFALSGIFIFLYNRLDIDQIFFRTLTLGAIFYVITFSSILLGVQSKAFFVFFKVFSYFFQVAYLSNYFTFLDQFFELQNAKRIFSILYSPIFLGMAVSGGILSLSFTSIGTFGILCLILASILTAVFLERYAIRTIDKIPDDHEEFTVIKTTKKELFHTIITSPFTVLFLLGCVALQSILVVTEYQYMSGLEHAYSGIDPDKLTSVLGKLYFWGSLINIFFGIFLYGRLVKKIGLNNVILIVPLFFTSLFASWFFGSHIFLSFMGFIAVEGVLNLLEDNNFNLLLNAVPLKLKNKIRITCESLLEPMGILLSSFLLMLFQEHSKALGLTLAIIFLVLTCLMRAYYAKGIFYNLISHLIPFQKEDSQLLKKVSRREFKTSRPDFLDHFFGMKEGEQLFLIESALRFNDMHFLDQLLKKMTKLGSSVKLKTLVHLENCPSSVTLKFLPYFRFWMRQHPDLQHDFFFHLSKMNLLDIEVAKAHLHHPSPKIRGASLLTLRQKLPRSFESKQARRILYQLLISLSEEDNLIAIQILKYERLKDFKSKVFELLSASSFRVKECILNTLPYLLEPQDTQYAPIFLKYLQDEEYTSLRPLLLRVLKGVFDVFLIKELLIRGHHFNAKEKNLLYAVILQQGVKAIPELESIVQNTHLPDSIRLMAAQILGKISHRHLRLVFNRIIHIEVERAYFYYYHMLTLDNTSPYPNTTLLKTALKNSLDSVIEFIIRSLAYLNRLELGEHLVQSLNSPRPKTYSHALETLQKMCSSKLYKELLLIIEQDSQSAFLNKYHTLGLPRLTLDNLLDRLEQTPSYVNQMIVTLIREQYDIPKASSSRQVELKQTLDHYTLELLEVSQL